MRWVLWIVGSIAALIAVMALVGAMLPQGHVVSRRARLHQPPEKVWAVITDIDAFPSWRGDVQRVERLPDREGRKVWREIGAQGGVTFEEAEAVPPRRLVGRIADKDLAFGGNWTYEIAPVEGGGSVITITENGEVYNVIFRFLSRFVFGHAGTLESYLKALGRKLGEDVVPEPAGP